MKNDSFLYMKLIETKYSRMPWTIEARETCSQRYLTSNMSNIIIPLWTWNKFIWSWSNSRIGDSESRVFLIFRVLVLSQKTFHKCVESKWIQCRHKNHLFYLENPRDKHDKNFRLPVTGNDWSPVTGLFHLEWNFPLFQRSRRGTPRLTRPFYHLLL